MVIAFLGMLALVVIGSVLRGFALKLLWAWFMVPLFHLPSLSIANAIGIALIVSFLTHEKAADEKLLHKEVFMKAFWASIGGVVSVLSVGYVVHLFM